MKFNGKKLREMRKKRGLTQAELAKELGVTGGTWVSNWENRIFVISGPNLTRLCEFFGNEARDWWVSD